MLTSCCTPEDISGNLQILPHDQSLDGTHLETFKGIGDTETVLAGVERNLVKVLLDQLLLLDKLDVGERICREFNSLTSQLLDNASGPRAYLIETVFTTVRDINNLDDLGE